MTEAPITFTFMLAPAFMCDGPPFWWLDTAFGSLVFVMFFVTWGLVIVALSLHILYLLRKLKIGRKK